MLLYFSLGILILILGASLFWRRSFGNDIVFSYIFLFSVVIIFILLFYQSYQQYQVWAQNEPSKFLLPPYQNIGYFIFYAGSRFFASYLISLAAAVLFFFLAKILNKKHNECFFYPEEYYLGAISLFLVGHPGWLFYGVFIIVFYLLIHIYSLFANHYSLMRISSYYLWLPTAIFVIIISKWLQALPFWQLLKL